MAAQNGHPHESKITGERVAKVIARSGLCSRREAETLIGDRRVSVNGAVIESAALDILPSDKVLVDGKPLSLPEPPRLWRYYKPKGRVTTHKDPEGRPTVFETLPDGLPRLISVGRLDFNTEGLLLLTNDGDLARHLELPATGWTRRYRVRAFGEVSEKQLQDLAGGLTVKEMTYGPIEASREREQGGNVWISVSIREGKNREVRRIMEHLGLTVNRLIRVSFGPFMLGDLEPGQIEEVRTAVLKDQLGPRLSRRLGVKREPVREERRLPSRGKHVYLRRQPAAKTRDQQGYRAAKQMPDARPLKRRRILEEGVTAAPKIEFVAEGRPRRSRFGENAGPSSTPHLPGRPRNRKDGREQSQKPGAQSRGKWEEPRPRDAGPKGSHLTPRDRKPFAGRTGAGAEETPRFRTSRRKSRPDFERQGEKPRPRQRAEEDRDLRHGQLEATGKGGKTPRRSFRRSDQSERKRFDARTASGHSYAKQAGGRSKPPHARKGAALRKRRPGPETDKERP